MVRDTLLNFLSLPSSQPKQIISLGAGFDTSYWYLKSQNALKENDRYYEIDFSQVVERKINIIKQNEVLFSLLGEPIELDDKTKKILNDKRSLILSIKNELEALKKEKSQGSKMKEMKEQIKNLEKELEDIEGTLCTSDYVLLKGDLRNLNSIKSSLINQGIDFSRPTLIMTECVLNYMPSSESDSVILWSCKEFDHVVYFSYDQIHPNDAFGHTMCTSLKNRNSPLLGIHPYYSTETQYLRYKSLGYADVFSVDVLSCYENCLDSNEKERINLLEDFDEHEEWIIKCQHYSFTIGANNANDYFESLKIMYKVKDEFVKDNVSYKATSSILQNSYWNFVKQEDKSQLQLLRWGHTSFRISDNKVLVFGGYGGDTKQIRNNTSLVLDTKTMKVNNITNIGDVPTPRIYHTSTVYNTINNVTYALVFGGRGSPKSSYNDFYSLQIHETPIFKKIDVYGDIPPPRWRHTAEKLKTECNKEYILIFGGRSSTERRSEFIALNDLYSINTETWESVKLECNGDIPSPRFSHTSICIENGQKMLIFGGFDGTKAFNDVYIFDFKFKTWKYIECQGEIPNPMFSHSSCLIHINNKEYMIVLGGCSLKKNNIGYIYDIEERSWSILNTSISIDPKDLLLVNHTSTLINNSIITIGGGALCFSFGSFYNRMTCLSLFETDNTKSDIELNEKNSISHDHKEENEINDNIKTIPLKVLQNITEDQLHEIFLQQYPVIIRGLDFGECIHKWKLKEYFYKHIDHEKLVSTRRSKSRSLDFINKNFEFVTMKFKEFIDKIFDNEEEYKYYFRSVGENARKERSDFWKSFPEIKDDFVIPKVLNPLVENKVFLSALRISSKDSQLWTHYDICDNFLFQIVGKKKVTLWRPDDIDCLYIQDSSSLVIDIDTPDLKQFPKFVNASQYVGLLEPGDTLFIPALWFHNVVSLNPSIAINVFWKSLDDSFYNSKDLYGNKMLVPVERVFEKLEEIRPLISSIPEPYRSFYGRQIIQKLESFLE